MAEFVLVLRRKKNMTRQHPPSQEFIFNQTRNRIEPRFGSSNATDVLRFGCRRVFGKIRHHQIGETIFFEIRAHRLSSAQMYHFNCRI
jgi:hypothetical protein